MKCCGYVRVSTSSQVKHGFSIRHQIKKIREYAKHHKWDLSHIYIDKGVSGLKEERPALDDMLLSLSDHNFILVLSTDRLWRDNIYVKARIWKALTENKTDIRSIHQPDYSIYQENPEKGLINDMMDALAKYQRKEVIRKLKQGRIQNALEGGYNGGHTPIGYSYKNKKLIINPEEAEAIKRIFKLRRKPPNKKRRSYQKIAEILNQEGYTVKSKPFHAMQIKRIIDRKKYYQGKMIYGSIIVDGKHERIV